MKFLLPCFFSIITVSFSTAQTTTLKLVDSIIIYTPSDSSKLIDVSMVDYNFIAEFQKWKEDGIHIELVNNRGKTFSFITKDSTISTAKSSIQSFESGLFQYKYSGKRIILYDTNTLTISEKQLNINFNKYSNPPNRSIYNRNDALLIYPLVVVNFSTLDKNGMSLSKTIKSEKKVFNKETPFMLYNIATEKIEKIFGSYPNIYKGEFVYFANKELGFAIDKKAKQMYVSFQASHSIDVYDLNSFSTSSIIIKGKFIDETKMFRPLTQENEAPNNVYYNLLADSYEDIFFFDSKIFRVYKIAIDSLLAKKYKPSDNVNSCPLFQTKLNWEELRLNKTAYLQQISKDGVLDFEIPFPSGTNTFIGYNATKKEYYFRKVTLKHTSYNKSSARIYVFKLE